VDDDQIADYKIAGYQLKYMTVCNQCGAVIADDGQHANWHQRLAGKLEH
jgi:hypothetical protein